MATKYFFFFFFFLITVFLLDFGLCLNEDGCTESRCGRRGPPVRFPFRIKGRQPDHCGFPDVGFDLSCSEKKETVLELPNSVKLLVVKIDYKSQMISTIDPHGCLPTQLRNINLSDSPFRYPGVESGTRALFNCTRREDDGYLQIGCSSNSPNYQVYSVYSENSIGDSSLLYCTKMFDVSPYPSDLFDRNDILHLSWFNPSCESCALKNRYCRLKPNNTSQPADTECYGNLKHFNWKSPKFMAPVIIIGLLILGVMVFTLYHIYNIDKIEKEYQSKIEKFLDDYKAFKPTRYSYADIKRMTNQFKEELGQGAYGTVYKGKLSDDILVAVKVLNNSKGDGEEFVNEVGTIGKIHHVNVVRFIGFCADGYRRALVYEYLSNDSLEKFICAPDAKDKFLGWKRLQDIAVGAAKGIEYLHQGCEQRILHFDIKPHNILLDQDFNPKVSDFGLAKLCAKDQSAVSMTTARGTIGYIAPEVFSRNFGSVSYKSDVYSFGMLVLEMVGGRKTVDVKEGKDEQIYFPEWIYNLLEEGEDLRLEIQAEEDAKIAKKLAIVGLSCIQWNPVDRPPMKMVLQMLEGEGENLAIPPNPFGSTGNPGRRLRELHQELEVISETE
ncbi:rust resistance kinase Lr10-like [Euphorbia lathyris]|uniref:rust resistance kinase Lr10-like n=1 Tax=Euphorbia lathyris TaxID=212925 RepID=UPI0033133F51